MGDAMTKLQWFDSDGNLLKEETVEPVVVPLDQAGALATLLAVLELSTVEDAASAVGLTPQDLVAEAEAWQAMSDINP